MSLAFNIAEPTRRGACPTLDAPMRTGDGLLARLRVEGSCVTPQQLAQVAFLARQHGNGLLEITARGNLQVRGLNEASAPRFADAVWVILPIATGLVIDVSPIAGEDPLEKADPRHLRDAIQVACKAFEDRLGPKVSVVIDGGGQVSLAALKADVRLVALADGWDVTIGSGLPRRMNAGGAVACAVDSLRRLADLGPDARGIDIATASPPLHLPSEEEGSVSGKLVLQNGYTCRITLPCGSAEAESLIDLAEAAEATGVETIRLAPGHALLLDNAPVGLIDKAASIGFITTANDPRLRVSACIGSAGCRSGHVAARALASQLATEIAAGRHLHVSGCSKGCAHPRPADVTLVGRADGIGLVFDGRAGDTPQAILGAGDIVAALRETR